MTDNKKTTEPLISSFSYLHDLKDLIIANAKMKDPKFNVFNINLCGSRFSGKTLQVIRSIVELGFYKMNVVSSFWRYNPQGATETMEEVVNVIENIYNIDLNRNNSNFTRRQFKIGKNEIDIKGYLSNRKSATPKLGSARKGIKKDIQIIIIDEVSEFENAKEVELIKQASGLGKIIVMFYMTNPWIYSHWFIKKIYSKMGNDKELEATLRNKGEKFLVEKKDKEFNLFHISNHRVNTYLHEAQHQALIDTWQTCDDNFARVVDLGLAGSSEGLIYAPILYKLLLNDFKNSDCSFIFGGLDWGTSTGQNGSATGLILGRIVGDDKFIAIDKEYYHSNANGKYKGDNEIVRELLFIVFDYIIENYKAISEIGSLRLSYDYAAGALRGLLIAEIENIRNMRKYPIYIIEALTIQPCIKYSVPFRINALKILINQQRVFINKNVCIEYLKELESAKWDDTKLVKGNPTREKENDHLLDAAEYGLAEKLHSLLPKSYLELYKN